MAEGMAKRLAEIVHEEDPHAPRHRRLQPARTTPSRTASPTAVDILGFNYKPGSTSRS